MSAHKSVHWIAFVVAIAIMMAHSHAQVRTLHREPTHPRDVSTDMLPIQPGYFDYDMQFFTPADITNFGGGPAAPIGWYAEYQRIYTNVSNSDNRPNRQGLWTWGNRWVVGFMTEEDHGWEFEYSHIAGPSLITGGTVNGTTGQEIRRLTATADLQYFEFNRTYRLKPLHDGSIIEAFIGGRYTGFRDESTIGASVNNSMFGGQVGMRWFKKNGNYTASMDVRGFAAQNFQYFGGFRQQALIAPGGSLRGKLQYNITRDFSLSFGGQFIYYAQGIARSQDLAFANQQLTYGGFTGGFEWNR